MLSGEDYPNLECYARFSHLLCYNKVDFSGTASTREYIVFAWHNGAINCNVGAIMSAVMKSCSCTLKLLFEDILTMSHAMLVQFQRSPRKTKRRTRN